MKQNGKVAYTPEYVESLKDGQVFVFGSNDLMRLSKPSEMPKRSTKSRNIIRTNFEYRLKYAE